MNELEPIYIGEVIRKLRIQRRLTQEQLAEACSLEPRSIYSIENNKYEPRLRTLYALATALDLEFIDLMKEINNYFKTKG